MLSLTKSRLTGKALFFIFIACFLSSFLYATIINVPADYGTIQAGINAATNTDTVLVQPAIYYGSINYNGKLITVGSLFLTTQDTSYISSTILDGYSSVSIVTIDNGEDSTAVLSGFTITNGYDNNGGGICCENNSNPSLENLTITGNSAGDGGGIYCYSNSNPSLQNVTISGNSSTYGGGIYCYSNSNPSLQNVTISGNSAVHFGGGICCFNNSSPSLENVIISGNTATWYGGGIHCDNSDPSLENVTISGNSASNGGGIYCDNSTPIIINSILWNDSPEEIYIESGSVTATYSDIQGDWTGTGNIDSDPLFVDAGSGDYHLQSASPCIDAGYPASPLDPDGTTADMGAYYFQQNPIADFTADTTNGNAPLTVNFTDTSEKGTGAIDEWYWEFGNGNNSILQNPSNEYQLPGIYTVSLTVTDVNDSTDTETKVDYITVHALPYSGPVWHISTTGSDITGNGSEQFPFASIQHGINSSSNTDTVVVQPGTYIENINYNGKLITVGSLFLTTQDTSYISTTIIDGNSSGNVVRFENGEDSTTVLCGFTIQNGNITGNGGGVYCRDDSSPSLESVTISGNSATYNGGGIFCSYSSPSLQNVTISGNSANRGGGIYCTYSNPSLQNVTISGNTPSLFGGGVYCRDDSSPSLESVTISGNSATYNGGGIYCNDSSPSLQNVTISGNSADVAGGGIYCWNNSNPSLQNVTITNNTAYHNGGGVYCSNSSPSLENVTITGNSASDNGGGIYCSYSSPSLINSILWNDSPEEIFISSGSITATYSDIQGGFTGTGNIDSDPLFVNPANGDYHLQPASPCIDAGDPASPLDPDSTIADMGAYFFPQFIPPDTDFTADITNGYFPLTVNFTDLSTQGSGVIDEWYWDFGDGNDSSLQDPFNEYQLPGIYTVSLTVTDVNDSIDTEIKIDYITVFGNDPPAPPTNVQVDIVHPDAVISWTTVDTTIYGDPCNPDGYVVYYNEMPDEEHFWFLGFTTNTDYTHSYVAQFSEQVFYNVVAYVDMSEDELNYLKEMNNTSRKVSQLEVKRELSRKGN